MRVSSRQTHERPKPRRPKRQQGVILPGVMRASELLARFKALAAEAATLADALAKVCDPPDLPVPGKRWPGYL